MTIDGKPFGPQRFSEIVEERYQISKRIHTSYNEVGEITPLERDYLLRFIKQDIENENKITQQILDKNK